MTCHPFAIGGIAKDGIWIYSRAEDEVTDCGAKDDSKNEIGLTKVSV